MIRNPQSRQNTISAMLLCILLALGAWHDYLKADSLPGTITLQTDGIEARVVWRRLDSVEWQYQADRVEVIQREGGVTVRYELDLVTRWEQTYLPVVSK